MRACACVCVCVCVVYVCSMYAALVGHLTFSGQNWCLSLHISKDCVCVCSVVRV